mmetsp:Transcript_9664/g.19724  ORF Transcript_9664/g.19724 Transcript_9664/m.19724 type:complete len:113 (-) Transcript_9664:242-580(-)|eukprot:CAMPEP_0184687472 /NCGR_PEP_ID=MMETSP0312-20130426/26528_1 /TAXON_ID=31354 /ORGANISM="Compsopogon coeruleus, Strain SAG 36.94" /LENGTH=112 /DNA_ID=CAMNT_0027143659 /DNA_START=46 /DNA_END=384 /DNA_ORIENTATION=-
MTARGCMLEEGTREQVRGRMVKEISSGVVPDFVDNEDVHRKVVMLERHVYQWSSCLDEYVAHLCLSICSVQLQFSRMNWIEAEWRELVEENNEDHGLRNLDDDLRFLVFGGR